MKVDYKDKLTVFIPIHDRQHYIKRVFYHYQKLCSTYNVNVIARDSSYNPFPNVEKFDWIDYQWVGPENNITKFRNALEEANTEFYLLAPDDDFYLVESIIKCVDFLSNNPKYSVAHGEFISLCSKQSKILRTAYKLQFYKGVTEQFFSEHAHHRLLHFLNVERYLMLNHSVVRRKSYLEGQRILFGNDFLTVTKFSDFIHSFALLCFGNVKTLPIVWGCRDTIRIMGTKAYPKALHPDIDLRQLPSRLIENTNPLSKLLAKCSGLSIEKCVPSSWSMPRDESLWTISH